MAKKFIRTTSENFNNLSDKSLYKDSIVFIEDTKQLWSNDIYYGGEKTPILFNAEELNINNTNEYYYTHGFLENLKITKIPIIGNTKVEFNGNNIKLQLPKEIILNNLVDFQGYAKYILNLNNNSCKIDKHEYDLSNYLIATYNDDATTLSNNNTLVFESLGGDRLLITEGPVSKNEILITEVGTSIVESLFYDCSGLTSITIPNSVTSIGGSAFYGCTSLTSIVIPNNVISIGADAFYNCSGLTSVVWNAVNCSDFSSTSNSPFCNIRKQITSFEFGNSVEYIPAYLCCGMTKLTSFTIPNNVTSIGIYAFQNCNKLTSITLSNNLTSIGNYAFTGCSNTSITIPNSVTSIAEGVFSYCSRLKYIVIPNSVNNIGYGSFACCYALTSITIPDSITSIERLAFYGCSKLTSVTMLSIVPPTLGADAFYSTSSNFFIYVPTESVDAYKAATNWSNYADQILPISN